MSPVLIALNGGHAVRPRPCGPDDTNPKINPRAIRAYAVPSCGACLRIAQRHGFEVGDRIDEGEIEGFTHADSTVMALAYTPEGYFVPVPLGVIEDRRRS